MTLFRLFSLLALSLIALAPGCQKAQSTPAPPPPPKVTVAHPTIRDVTQWDEYTGRLDAVDVVAVKCQVSGFVATVPFTEGALVKAGDLLLTIDDRVYKAQLDNAQAAVNQAKAGVQLAQATLQLALNDLKRGEEAGRGSLSPEELDTRRFTVTQDQAAVAQAQAAIGVAQAAVESAQLNVNWCTVTAPIAGRISSKMITPGNFLTGGPGSSTTITTITSVDPIYCYFDVDEAAVLKYQKLAREKKRVSAAEEPIPCFMGLANDAGFPHDGTIDFVDNQINPTTGTHRRRGVFSNSDGTLLPGFFAHVRVAGQELSHAMLVTDECVGVDQDRKYIYVMHPDRTIERRIVTTGPLIGSLRVITSNLKDDDLVIINGISSLGMVRPGGTVDPTTVSMPEPGQAPAATQASPATQSAAQTAPATPEAGK